MPRYRQIVAALAAVPVAAIAVSSGARRADARVASRYCWANLSAPVRTGNDVDATVTWQCNEPVQQYQILLSLTTPEPSSQRYNSNNQCYNSSCSAAVTAPYNSIGGNWKSRADYAYVVFYDGTSQYFFGQSATGYL